MPYLASYSSIIWRHTYVHHYRSITCIPWVEVSSCINKLSLLDQRLLHGSRLGVCGNSQQGDKTAAQSEGIEVPGCWQRDVLGVCGGWKEGKRVVSKCSIYL